ncbi:MAG TPA: glycosyltransferase 87 family protein, partial [Polyangiaceae bacterium LLY-WYZ-15_(1-7)]|nr:glycosyltransferase 87 family protein [Polyangiaceae bacterium LLY-WYZ-15_(1-7)]
MEVAARYAPNTWINRDGRFYTNCNVTLVEDLSLDQSEFCASWYDGEQGWNRNLDAGWSNVALGTDGRRLPKHPVLMPILSTPLFWALGLHGTLVFNVLGFALCGALAFAFARRFAPPGAAAAAGLAFVLATGIRDYAYDYHVDILLLFFFLAGLVALKARRGWLAGLLLGGTVVLKPTALMFLPSLAILASRRRDLPVLLRALGSGTLVLLALAAANWALFGKPWWAGYNRVLVVVGGEPQVADVSNAFSVPLGEGLKSLWSGPFGIRDRLTLMFFAVPGLLRLWTRWRYVLATLLALALSIGIFAKYQWYGDRFLWPAFALLTPALAVSFELVAAGLARLRRRAAGFRPRPAALVGVAAGAVLLASLVGGGRLEDRWPKDGAYHGATALAQGQLELRNVFPEHELAPRRGLAWGERAGGGWLARVSPVVSVVAAPFALGGERGLALLAVLLFGLLAWATARLGEAAAPGATAAAGALALALFPGLASRASTDLVGLLVAVFALGALAAARAR